MKCENCLYSKMAITAKDRWETSIEFKCTLDHIERKYKCKKKEDEKMTNWDKFKDQITTTNFAINEKGDIVRCCEIKCSSCDFRRTADSRLLQCSERKSEWLKKECKDKPTISIKQKISEVFRENLCCVEPCEACSLYSRNNSHGIPCDVYVDEIGDYIQNHKEDMDKWIKYYRLKKY